MARARTRLNRRRRRTAIAAVVCVALIAIGGLVLFRPSSSDAAVRRALETEFDGAYGQTLPGDGELVEIEITAAPATIELQDGTQTEVWAYNGMVPGPAIRVNHGDTLRVVFRNDLSVPTTLHWHGVRVPNPMDGVAGVTQPAVEPGESFIYEFRPPDAGTFWYHSHVNSTEQVGRGLYGSVVVVDETSADFNQDVLWVVDDWPLAANGQIDGAFNSPTDVEHNGRWGALITVNGATDTELRARPGERIRLRVLNASTARVYATRFPDLEATLMAVDGLYTRGPEPADATLLSPGNRIDVDLIAPDEPGRYDILDDFSRSLERLGTLVVEGDPIDTPGFATPSNPAVPRWDEATDVGVDIDYKLTLGVRDGRSSWLLNGRSFDDVDPFSLDAGDFTRIRFTNNSPRLHPMHVHGQFFKILSRNGEPVDDGAFRDSVLLFADDQIDVGMIAVDQGMWLLHCHILEHAAAGMITLLEVKAPPSTEPVTRPRRRRHAQAAAGSPAASTRSAAVSLADRATRTVW